MKLKINNQKNIPKNSAFKQAVFRIVKKIPKGSVLTYGEVAKKIGKPRAARAVGAVLKTNFDPKIPCHRVIRSDGRLGGYNRGIENKKRILDEERKRSKMKGIQK